MEGIFSEVEMTDRIYDLSIYMIYMYIVIYIDKLSDCDTFNCLKGWNYGYIIVSVQCLQWYYNYTCLKLSLYPYC